MHIFLPVLRKHFSRKMEKYRNIALNVSSLTYFTFDNNVFIEMYLSIFLVSLILLESDFRKVYSLFDRGVK